MIFDCIENVALRSSVELCGALRGSSEPFGVLRSPAELFGALRWQDVGESHQRSFFASSFVDKKFYFSLPLKDKTCLLNSIGRVLVL